MREFDRDRISLINSKLESSSSMWNFLNGIMQEAIEKFVRRKSTTLKSHKPLTIMVNRKSTEANSEKNTNCGKM